MAERNRILETLRYKFPIPERELYLSNLCLQNYDIPIVADFIMSPSASTLRTLCIGGNRLIDDEGGVKLCSALTTSKYCKLQMLSFCFTGIGTETVKELRKYLHSPSSSKLNHLDLGYNSIGDNEIQILYSGLEIRSPQLMTLSVTGCEIRYKGALMLEYLLTDYRSSLLYLSIHGSDDMEVSQIKARLESFKWSKRMYKDLHIFLGVAILPTKIREVLTQQSWFTESRMNRFLNILKEIFVTSPIIRYATQIDCNSEDDDRKTIVLISQFIDNLRSCSNDVDTTSIRKVESYFRFTIDIFIWRLSFLRAIIHSKI